MKDMRALKKDLDKLKYDSFLNGIEDAFIAHRSHDHSDEQLIAFAKDLIERFVRLYSEDENTDLRMQTKKIVLEYIMNNN